MSCASRNKANSCNCLGGRVYFLFYTYIYIFLNLYVKRETVLTQINHPFYWSCHSFSVIFLSTIQTSALILRKVYHRWRPIVTVLISFIFSGMMTTHSHFISGHNKQPAFHDYYFAHNKQSAFITNI